jgi:hypothetical protein
MNPTNDKLTQPPVPVQPQAAPPAAQESKRFRLVRLEERVAPSSGSLMGRTNIGGAQAGVYGCI